VYSLVIVCIHIRSGLSEPTHTLHALGIPRSANCDTGRGWGGGWDKIPARFCFWRLRSGPAFCSSCSSWSSGSTRCRNLLVTIGELLRLERRAAESDYCALMPSPHINCCQDAVDRGKMGGMSATLENIRVNLPSPEKYRITYCSCSGSRRAISSLHLSTK
jgi:hypothetical protein